MIVDNLESPSIRFVMSDQLNKSISSLIDLQPSDIILFGEFSEEATNVNHHPKKLAFLFSAMRHFALELKDQGHQVEYLYLDNPDNSGNLTQEISRILSRTKIKRLIVTEPSEYRLLQLIKSWPDLFDVQLEIRTDTRFLCAIAEFKQWSAQRKQLRMEYFYREMRKKYFVLMEPDGTPCGGAWNFDKENRKAAPKSLKSPKRISHPKDQITKAVLKLVKEKFSHHFGNLEPFHYAVTREQALIELKHFIKDILPNFGDYQDAMVKGEAYLYHSLLSTYLNAGLLLPQEIIEMAENSFRKGLVKINCAEGFIRQILGWREFIRGVYWLQMPEYADLNFFNAIEPMPDFYWTTDTKMICLSEAISQTRDHAYSHHIQRLMLTGNFALLADLDVKQVQKWYLEVYSDAFEWVEMPNTLGMALFGDGGIVASKPYAASGKYINKMSNFCQSCPYDPNETTAENACPFNALYWDFMARNRTKLDNNHRLPFVYATWDKFGIQKQHLIRQKAKQIINNMREGIL